jgi:hypothetical protein
LKEEQMIFFADPLKKRNGNFTGLFAQQTNKTFCGAGGLSSLNKEHKKSRNMDFVNL